MTSTFFEDLEGFLDDILSDLTGLHVKAMQFQNAPHDQDAVNALAAIPAGLIERAAALKTQLDAQPGDAEATAKPKPKAKPSASRR